MSQRVLVVDDDEDILYGLKEVLESPCVEVSTAQSKEEAEALLKIGAYDVVIADLMLSSASPEDGLKLVQYVKAHHASTKTIVVTGCGESDVMDRAHEAGADLFLAKPVGGGFLHDALKSFAGEKEAARLELLVIEPNGAQRLLYDLELTEEGYEVTSSDNLEDVEADQGGTPPVLVLMDGGEHRSSLMEKIQTVRRAFPAAIVVVHTASLALTSEGQAEPGEAFLIKSSDLEGLKHAIRSLLLAAGGRHGSRVLDSIRGPTHAKSE